MWAGFDGRSYTREQWAAHVAQTDIFPGAIGIIEHSTGVPTLEQWLRFDESNYIRNTQIYYENSLHWSHGPHLFASYKDICGFSALSVRGTHASCFNYNYLGGECGINRNTEDWSTGPGALALNNQHFAFACLFVKMGKTPNEDTFKPHSECHADGHFQCPVENWEQYRGEETEAIVSFMNVIGKLQLNPALAAQAVPIYPKEATAPVGSIAWCQNCLNNSGATPKIDVDGDFGPATRAATYSFQGRAHIIQDGILGPQTISMLKFYDKTAAAPAAVLSNVAK